MKTLKQPTKIILLFMLMGSFIVSANEINNRRLIENVGFLTPESVEYNSHEDVYLVTNINGHPLAKDGNGFISKLSPDGKVIELKWLDGAKPGTTLHAPKGASIINNLLYVTDINQIQIFSLPDGQQKKSITIAGSTFLNGITPGQGDFVYVTDSGLNAAFKPTGTDAIYKVWGNGRYELVVKDEKMGAPNGLWDNGNGLQVVTFNSGRMIHITRSGKQKILPTPPSGGLDGLVKLDDGRFLFSSWGGSAIYALNEDNTYSLFADALDAPADLGVDSKRNRLLIPLFKQNAVVYLPF